jgi:RNA polymerase sigma-54 factor
LGKRNRGNRLTMMHMEHRLAQTQTQRLMLTQKMQQAIQMLQLNAIELEQFVQQELETNPVLEQLEQEPNAEDLQPVPVEASDESGQFEDGSFDIDSYANQLLDYRREGTDLSRGSDMDGRRDFYEQSITREESLSSQLYQQLKLTAPDEESFRVAERILGDLDGRGYFSGSLEEVAAELSISMEEAERGLRLVQSLEPVGIGARDVVECLLLQIDSEYPAEPQLKELVAEHLEALEHRQIPKIAKAMKVTVERIEELTHMLAALNPWPGSGGSDGPPQYVVPEIIVEKDDDEEEYRVYLTDETSPVLKISEDYRHMMKTGNMPKPDKKFLREKMESAKWLIRNLEQRKRTILRIATAITEVQKDFFDKGAEYIKPLTLQEIADKVGVHEATVSRTVRGKYMQTPQGLFEMKYFFSPGLKKDGGDEQSSKSVQTIIKKIFEDEDKTKPLSDQKVADLLKSQGTNVARRTVTKYREILGILPTNLRRQYASK